MLYAVAPTGVRLKYSVENKQGLRACERAIRGNLKRPGKDGIWKIRLRLKDAKMKREIAREGERERRTGECRGL